MSRDSEVMPCITPDDGAGFMPCVVYHDDTWDPVAVTFDIVHARQAVSALAASHDLPVHDWTRPAPITIEPASPADLLSRLTAKGRGEDSAPVWGCGWEWTDRAFTNHADDAAFMRYLDEAITNGRQALLARFYMASDIDQAERICRDVAVRRWRLLRAANESPAR